MRRLLAFALAFALAASGAALAGRGDPQKRLTPADQARARAMLVRKADFPGFKVGPPPGAEADFYCAALDESDLTITGEAESRQFALGTVFVGSVSQVYESRADASASWRRGTSAAGVRCAASVLRRELATPATRFVSLRKIAFPRVSDRTHAFRATLSATTPQGEFPLYVDIVALMRSRAHASVILGSALTPMPRDEELRLARLVAKRMATAMRGA